MRSRSDASAGSAKRASAACRSASSAVSSGRAARTVVSASRSSPSTICGRCASTSPRRRVTVPASGSSKPARIRMSVDFPPPLGPRTPMREPASTSRSAPSRIFRPPKDLVIPRAANCGTDGTSASVAALRTPGNRATRINGHLMAPAIHLGPDTPEHLVKAIEGGGGTLTPLDEAEAVVWVGSPDELPELPGSIKWVQLQSAGIEHWVERVRATPGVKFTTATGAYSAQVAEHAVGLLIAGV